LRIAADVRAARRGENLCLSRLGFEKLFCHAMKKNLKWIVMAAIVCILAGVFAVSCGTVRAGYETAPFKTVKREGNFELRDYPPLVLAKTPMRGADGSFMRLFRFISGQNSEQKKIAMTTPVFFEGEATNAAMSFVMPAGMTPTNAPKPNDNSVSLQQADGGRFAVLRFRGGRNAQNETQALQQLQEWMSKEKLTNSGGPIYAYFDPPWTPGMFRRNEVMLRVQTSSPTE
jgi:DNA gyrase inhibitor GyrI